MCGKVLATRDASEHNTHPTLMSSQRLRLKIATIALASENGRKLALQIPPGAEIVVPAGVLAGPFSGNQQIDVEWDS